MRYRKPEELKESGIKWVNEIPGDWEEVNLKFLFFISKGNGFSKYYDSQNAIGEELIPYLSMEYLRKDDVDNQYINSNESHVLVTENDTLILWDGSNAGEFIKGKFGALSTTLSKISPKRKVERTFSYYLLKAIEKRIKDNTVGMGIPHVNPDYLKSTKLPLPGRDEQHSIATFLDRKTEAIDGVIQKKEQLIERLKEKRQVLITQAVTNGLDSDVLMENSDIEWLDEKPKHWENTRLRFLADINTGSKNTEDTEEDGEYPFYVRSPIIRSIDDYSFDEEAVLTSGDGAGVCEIYHYVNGKYELHQRMYRITDFKEILGRYLYYYMIANFKKDVMKFSAKSTVDSLRMHMFKNFPIVYGSKKEQEEIVNYIEDQERRFESIISDLETQIEKLKEYRQSLISAAVTGKIDVRDEVEVESKEVMA